ncbi:thioesterase family protein [Thermatribacter velox]|jgi:predicted thioesterase|uniref:Thioesterase family protein n=1 Tax=Thermatribacter velox TaxID=3039681 RepID=A0ABZ2YFM8_9BACT|nr:fluoroacetyl-CoA thioesterase [Candidatus Atribacteria bacterium]
MKSSDLRVGLTGVVETTVNDENTADRFDPDMVPAFATPMLVSLMDNAAHQAVKNHLPEGYISVGTRVSVSHVAATPKGMKVTVRATLVEIYRNKLVFEAEAFDEVEKIGEGRLERFVINREKFLQKLQAKAEK